MSKKVLSMERLNLPNCCAVREFGAFEYREPYWDDDPLEPPHYALGGAELGCAGFIDDEDCRAAYEFLAKKHKILFQSTVRKNISSGNDFFFVVYGKKG